MVEGATPTAINQPLRGAMVSLTVCWYLDVLELRGDNETYQSQVMRRMKRAGLTLDESKRLAVDLRKPCVCMPELDNGRSSRLHLHNCNDG